MKCFNSLGMFVFQILLTKKKRQSSNRLLRLLDLITEYLISHFFIYKYIYENIVVANKKKLLKVKRDVSRQLSVLCIPMIISHEQFYTLVFFK